MKETKTQKGITLVALIITIVVLLILAVISIGAVKDSGIIGHSQKASSDYTIEKEKEEIKIALKEWTIEKNAQGADFKTVIARALENVADITKENEDGSLEVTFRKTQNSYTITKDGEKNDSTEAKYKAYGTEEYYMLVSLDNDVFFVENGEVILNTKMVKKGKEEYLSELSETEADFMRTNIEAMETTCEASAEYLMFIEGMNNGYPIGGAIGNKMVFGEYILDLNENLAKNLSRDKSTYNCYRMDLFGVEAIVGVDFKNKLIDSVSYQNGTGSSLIKYSAEIGKIENKKIVEVYLGEPNEKRELEAGTEYIYYNPGEGDSVIYIQSGDDLLYTTSIGEGESGSVFKLTKCDETYISKLGLYYK